MEQPKKTNSQQVQVQEKIETMQKVVLGVGMLCAFFTLVNFGIVFGMGAKNLADKFSDQNLNWATIEIKNNPVKIIANPINNDYKNFLVSSYNQQPLDETNDLNLHPGWPVRLNVMTGVGAMWPGIISPVVDDLNNDGMKELIIFTQGEPEQGNPSKLFIYGQAGRLLTENSSLVYNFNPWTIPSIADINNDGQKEILITAHFWYENMNKILIFNNQGRVINSFNEPLAEYNSYYSSLLIADINHDNNKEIVYIGLDNWRGLGLVVLDSSGRNLSGFPIFLEIAPPGLGSVNPAIADFNHDGYKEIVVAASSQDTGPVSYVRAYNYQGNLLWETTTSITHDKLIAADVNNDGVDEIVLNSIGGLYVLGYNGLLKTHYQLPVSPYNGSPAVGDLNNDGELEVAFSHDANVYVIHSNGQLIYVKNFDNFDNFNPTLIADINGDDQPEVIFGRLNKIYAWDILGNLIQDFPLTTRLDSLYIIPTVADIDNNGRPELISNVSSYYWSSQYKPLVYVWDLPGQSTPVSYEWPMFAHDVRHTGNYRSAQ